MHVQSDTDGHVAGRRQHTKSARGAESEPARSFGGVQPGHVENASPLVKKNRLHPGHSRRVNDMQICRYACISKQSRKEKGGTKLGQGLGVVDSHSRRSVAGLGIGSIFRFKDD